MEGIVKFNCYWSQSGPVISDEQYEIINHWRDILFNLDLVGAYENGVGFGNISIRIGNTTQFFITGSSTGDIPELEPGHYVKVSSYNIDDNAVMCSGPLKASSESLTHAAIYTADPGTHAIIHVHSGRLWDELKDNVPTTDPSIEYGTPGMAREMIRIFSSPEVFEKRIIVMAGDKGGLITFGNDLDEAAGVLFQYFNKNL
jgi:L-ribulose-5-phosphate 4-epimerase